MRRKNIVISGGSKGIGRAIAEVFFSKGFDIAVSARDSKELNRMKNYFASVNDEQKVLAISCDMSVKEDVEDFAKQVIYEFDEIDVVVNNAGIFKPRSILEEADGVFEQTINTNLASAYHLSRNLIPAMPEKNGSHLFNICSTASITPYINGGSYCISKFALLGLSRVLREELKAKEIKVTAVLPGATYTQSWQQSELPPERFMKPEEIAEIIWSCYNMSPAAVVEELLIRPMLGDLG